MLWLFSILIFCAFAQDGTSTDPCARWDVTDPQADTAPLDPLEHAREVYISGCPQRALLLFQDLTDNWSGEKADRNQLKALAFLAEVKYKLGDREGSLLTFQRILAINPGYQISVLDHDPEAVSLFKLAQALRENEPPPPAPPPKPDVSSKPLKLPAYGYLPFGTPQFKQRKPGLGALHATLQTTTAVASIGLHIHMARKWSAPFRATDVKQANVLRYGVQWPVTLVFWGSYLISHFQARKHWKNNPPTAPMVTVQFEGHREYFGVSTRFNVL